MTTETIGQRIKRLRKDAGMSQEELGHRCRFNQKSVSNWECGKTQPKLMDSMDLAKALGVTLGYLAYGERE